MRPASSGKIPEWHTVRMGGEEQSIAGQAVVRPLVVDAEVLDRGLDLDDPDFAAGSQPDHVGALAGGERELRQHGEAVGA